MGRHVFVVVGVLGPRVLAMTPLTFRLVVLALEFFQDLVYVLLKIGGQREAREVLVLSWGEDHEAAEETAVDVGADVAPVIMERPRTDGVVLGVERVGPRVPGADLIRAATVGALRAEGPRSVRIDAVVKSM